MYVRYVYSFILNLFPIELFYVEIVFRDSIKIALFVLKDSVDFIQ